MTVTEKEMVSRTMPQLRKSMRYYKSLYANEEGVAFLIFLFQELFDATDRQVLILGVQNSDHRSRILSSLQLLAAKCRSNSATSSTPNNGNCV